MLQKECTNYFFQVEANDWCVWCVSGSPGAASDQCKHQMICALNPSIAFSLINWCFWSMIRVPWMPYKLYSFVGYQPSHSFVFLHFTCFCLISPSFTSRCGIYLATSISRVCCVELCCCLLVSFSQVHSVCLSATLQIFFLLL